MLLYFILILESFPHKFFVERSNLRIFHNCF